MAKKYARLNWQNAPSVSTPINATNLNKMDKAIDDLDDAVETITNNLASHKAESVSQEGGAHGLEIEEGTWTPALVGLGSTGTISYTYNNGLYVRVGSLVYFTCYLHASSTPQLSGIVGVEGLPYPSRNTNVNRSGAVIQRHSGIEYSTGRSGITAQIQYGNARILLEQVGSGLSTIQVTDSNISGMVQLWMNGWYIL